MNKEKLLKQLEEAQETIDSIKKQLDETEFEEGGWYYDSDKNGEYLFAFSSDDSNRVYGFFHGKWTKGNWTWDRKDKVKPAEDKIVGQALIKEAEKREFHLQCDECLFNPESIEDHSCESDGGKYYYNKKDNCLWYNSNVIFSNGKWATVEKKKPIIIKTTEGDKEVEFTDSSNIRICDTEWTSNEVENLLKWKEVTKAGKKQLQQILDNWS